MGEEGWGRGEVSWDELGGQSCGTYLPNQASVPQTQQRPVQIPPDPLDAAKASSSLPSTSWTVLESPSSLYPPMNCSLHDLSTVTH